MCIHCCKVLNWKYFTVSVCMLLPARELEQAHGVVEETVQGHVHF